MARGLNNRTTPKVTPSVEMSAIRPSFKKSLPQSFKRRPAFTRAKAQAIGAVPCGAPRAPAPPPERSALTLRVGPLSCYVIDVTYDEPARDDEISSQQRRLLQQPAGAPPSRLIHRSLVMPPRRGHCRPDAGPGIVTP